MTNKLQNVLFCFNDIVAPINNMNLDKKKIQIRCFEIDSTLK